MAPSHSMALAPEDIAQHPGFGKRILQMQFVIRRIRAGSNPGPSS